MLQLFLAGKGESREEVMLDAPRRVVVTKEGRKRRGQQVRRLPQRNREFGKLWLVDLTGRLQHQVGPPARLKQGPRGPTQRHAPGRRGQGG